MKIKISNLLISKTGLNKYLSITLLIFFSINLLYSISEINYQADAHSNLELCDLPLSESESSGKHESQKENSEEFLPIEKPFQANFSIATCMVFFIKDAFLPERIKEFPTPPPKRRI